MLVSTALSGILYSGVALAQANERSENPAQNAEPSNALEQVVVTATRQVDTVNRVPLAVTAQTQRNLDQQGIRTVRDLQNLVPSLQTTQSLASGASQFSLRGVGFLGSNPAGNATVGFYLDDTPLQKRNVGGGVATSNGTPLPPLFDLDRVEVLRGPQGTLYGGSSEGGTIRYIQPAPSLTRFSEYVRVQGSIPDAGDKSGEAGVAIGGPIVKDKLGFRASVFARHQGGYLDYVDPVTKKVWANDANSSDIRMMRGALTWAPSESTRVTADFFSSRDTSNDVSSSYNLPYAGTITVPTLCFNLNNSPNPLLNTVASQRSGNGHYDAAGNNTDARGGAIDGANFTPNSSATPYRLYPVPVARGDAACAAHTATGDVTKTLPGATYGPFNLDRYQTLSTDLSPSKTNLQIATLTIDHDFGGKMSFKSITSYIDDQTKTITSQETPAGSLKSAATANDPTRGTIAQPTGPTYNVNYNVSNEAKSGHFVSNNRRYGLTQELRFSSPGDARPFSWVGGVFFSNMRGTARYDNYQPMDYIGNTLYGYPNSYAGVIQRYGVPGLETANGLFNNFDAKRQTLKDIEIAAFAEGNYSITDKLRLTAGLRVSRVSFDYWQVFYGPVTQVAIPTEANGGTNSGHVAESPVTPKFSVNYNLTENDLVYISAAKGFRAGGVNSYVSYGICYSSLDQFGLKPQDFPSTYKSDSVWSYELGGKFRLLDNRVQINAAVYRIDWNDAQYTTNAGGGCGLVSTFNLKGVRSQGVELEAQARLFRNFLGNVAFGYTDSYYTARTVGVEGIPGPTNNFVKNDLVLVLDKQKIGQPPWTLNLGGRYDVAITTGVKAYVRADWRYTRKYFTNPFGTANFSPDSGFTPNIQSTNLRLGVEYKALDINLFANNVFDRTVGPTGGGRSGCALPAAGGTAACTTYSGYNPLQTINTGLPREIGLQIAYRH
jgi:outer membrane receptor protein involved in Fe transport